MQYSIFNMKLLHICYPFSVLGEISLSLTSDSSLKFVASHHFRKICIAFFKFLQLFAASTWKEEHPLNVQSLIGWSIKEWVDQKKTTKLYDYTCINHMLFDDRKKRIINDVWYYMLWWNIASNYFDVYQDYLPTTCIDKLQLIAMQKL